MREGWRKTTLGEIASVVRGVSWSKKQETAISNLGAVPVVRIGNVQLDGINMSDRLYVTGVSARDIETKAITPDSILMVGSNGNPKRVGNVYLSGPGLVGHLFASFIIGINVHCDTSSAFVWRWLQQDRTQSEMTDATSGSTGLKNLSLNWLRSFPILLPPLDEQRRIVGLIAAVDEAIEAAEGVKSAADQARRGLLGELLSEERARREGWQETTLGEVVDILDSRRVPVSASERARRPGPVPYFGATGQAGWIDDALFSERLILLGEDGVEFLSPNVQKAYLVDGPAWVNNHAHVLRAHEAIMQSNFLCYWLNSSVDYSDFASYGTRSKLTQASMRLIPILLPPLDEQRRIVDIVSAAEEHASAADSLANTLRSLRSALLADLLSGDREIPASYDELLST